jgi:hypothetical protein
VRRLLAIIPREPKTLSAASNLPSRAAVSSCRRMTRNEAALEMVVSELDRRYDVLEPNATTYRHIIAAYAAIGRTREVRRNCLTPIDGREEGT